MTLINDIQDMFFFFKQHLQSTCGFLVFTQIYADYQLFLPMWNNQIAENI